MTRGWILAAALAIACAVPAHGEPVHPRQLENFVEVSPFADGENWFLTRELDYEVDRSGERVRVPRGFVTDFASIPRPFWSVLPKWGKYGPPSIVHDYLYWDQRCTREQADAIMLIAMTEAGVDGFWRTVIHWALRVGGALAWRENARLRRGGREREIPAEFFPPVNQPTLTWKKLQDEIRASGHRPAPRPTGEPPPPYCAAAARVWRELAARR